jgi:tetratricopeptide (TPR) repeat protein/TolB-like protein/predicted Ser/Thr protein kinase
MSEFDTRDAHAVSSAQSLSGKTIGRFIVGARLGAGGMGEVYRAHDTRLRRTVALKHIAPHLRADRTYRNQLQREAENASRLNDSHIAAVYDLFDFEDESFLVMEFVEGETLRQRLHQRFTLSQFLDIAVQCADALNAAHQNGIVHSDIKPENIMLTPVGQVKILDFGVAKHLPRSDQSTTMDRSTRLSGTSGYMAPEVLLEITPDGRADIFSLGIVFYEALTGRHPFSAGSFVATSERILHESPPPITRFNPEVPSALQGIVTRMLEKRPQDRYPTAAALLSDLHALQKSEESSAVPHFLQPIRPHKNVVVKGLAALALAVIGAVLLLVWKPFRHSAEVPLPGDKMVAVLPFSAGTDAQAVAFTDGLTETLTAKLTQLTMDPTLQVIPAMEVRAKTVKDLDGARREFGAMLVVEGSLHRSGDLVRINIAVVDTHSRSQLRARTLTVDAADPFKVQDEVVNAVVQMLDLEIRPSERQALEAHGTQQANAYDFYLQGRGYLQNYDKPENVQAAIQVFNRALQLDPGYALAYAGRGDAHWQMYLNTEDPRWIAETKQDCSRALELSPRLSAAHICLGQLYKGTGSYLEAANEFESVIGTDPTDDQAYRELAEAYALLGKPEQAEATYRRAIQLRPHYWAGYNWLGVFYYTRSRYREAAEMFEQVVALAPDNERGLFNLGQAYIDQGRYTEAIAILQRSVDLRPTALGFTDLGNAYFYLRQFSLATSAYEHAVQLDDADPLLWWNLGDGYYWTPGRRPEAAAAYQRAIKLGESKLKINPKNAYVLGIMAVCHAMRGERRAALASLQEGIRLKPDEPAMLFNAALVYNQFNDNPRTLLWLGKALAAGFSVSAVRDNPAFDHLSNNSEFQKQIQPR